MMRAMRPVPRFFGVVRSRARRTYSPMEREFLRAFVTTTSDPFVVTLTGQLASGGTR